MKTRLLWKNSPAANPGTVGFTTGITHPWLTLDSPALRPRAVGPLIAALFILYLFVLHPWMMSWGATPAEQAMSLPGDALINEEPVRVTRAITISAPPEKIWPWLMQIGQDRAGFYSYDFLENLFSSGMPEVHEIHPEWQQRYVGERIPMSREDALGGALGDAIYFTVKHIEPQRAIDHMGLFVLLPVDANTTRVVWREHGGTVGAKSTGQWIGAAFARVVYDPMHFTMVRQMLRGVKAHAEGHPYPPRTLDLAARAGWVAATAGVLGLFLSRRRWWIGLVLPLALAYVTVWKTGDWDAAMAGFLSLGISLLGFFAFGRRWTMPFLLLAAFVLLVILFAPDAWIAFGLIFAMVVLFQLAARSPSSRGLRAAPLPDRSVTRRVLSWPHN
jgi:hypothetical protein